MSTREEHPSNLLIFLAWSEEKQKRTGSHTFQKKQKGTSITERPEYIKDREEFRHWEGDLSLDLEMDRMVHILLSLKERHASTI